MSNESRYQQRLSTFAANWRALALRGLLALLFGLVVLFWPGLVLTVLALCSASTRRLTGRSPSYPRSDPRTGARRSHFRWPKGRWVSSQDWWPSSGLG